MDIVETIIKSGINSATAILLVALGETIVERSGILNLGLEGLLLFGALIGFIFSYLTGSVFIGFLLAIIMTGIFNLIHGVMTITLKANQTVSGLALTFLGVGISSFIGRNFVGKSAPHLETFPIPLLSKIPFVGNILFNQNIIVYISFILVFILWFFLYKTRGGLSLQICGENPITADTAGINVTLNRYLAIFVGGALAGLGGAFLTLGEAATWVDNISAGKGWIAVAIVIFGRWDPIKVALASYLFGTLYVLPFRLQIYGLLVPSNILSMTPYVFTIVVLIITSIGTIKKRSGSPKALGIPYDREIRD